MNYEKISKKYDKLTQKLIKIAAEMRVNQEECDHMGVWVSYHYDGGNYCDEDNIYTMKWSCPHCRKRWETDQSYDNRKIADNMQAEVIQ